MLSMLLLAVPPALARQLCVTVDRAPDCCAAMAMPAAQAGPVQAAAGPENNCGQECCSISAPQLPATDGQSKAKAEAPSADYANEPFRWELPATIVAPARASIIPTPRARHLLLQVFRI